MGRMTRKTAAPKEVTRDDIKRLEQRYPALKALNDATLDKARGFAITKADCIRICGGSEKEFACVRRKWVESVLWVLGITIEYEHATKQYRFIEAEAHLKDRHQRVMSAQEKRHRAEWQRLGVMRDADLSDHQRRLRLLAMDSHTRAAGQIEAAREQHRIAVTTPETLPRIHNG